MLFVWNDDDDDCSGTGWLPRWSVEPEGYRLQQQKTSTPDQRRPCFAVDPVHRIIWWWWPNKGTASATATMCICCNNQVYKNEREETIEEDSQNMKMPGFVYCLHFVCTENSYCARWRQLSWPLHCWMAWLFVLNGPKMDGCCDEEEEGGTLNCQEWPKWENYTKNWTFVTFQIWHTAITDNWNDLIWYRERREGNRKRVYSSCYPIWTKSSNRMSSMLALLIRNHYNNNNNISLPIHILLFTSNGRRMCAKYM